MTATMEVSPATTHFSEWLDRFGAALEAGEVDQVVSMFGAESYWRDLVSFTWNIVTVEGQDGVREMLEDNLARTKPSNFQILASAA